MVRRVLEIIYDRHNEWVFLVQAFGCNKDTAEDITQEMYLRMHKVLSNGTDVMYNETEVNAYYVLKTLKSIFIDMKRKENNKSGIEVEWEGVGFSMESDHIVEYDQKYEIIKEELKNMYWFDSKVFELINAGENISSLSRKTTIPYYTLYNTYKKVYNHLKQLL